MAGAFGGPYTSMAGQNQNAGQINGQSNLSGNSASAAGNRSFTSHIAGMSKPQLYDLMSQMKVLIEQNEQQARQILVANPAMTKTLFQQSGSSQTNMGVPFRSQAQPPLPSQPPPQQLYQMNSGDGAVGPVSHAGPDISGQGVGHGNLSSVGHGIQPGWGSKMVQDLSNMGSTVSWQPVPSESAANALTGVQHSTIPSGMGGFMNLNAGMIAGTNDSAGQPTGILGSGMNTGPLDMGGSSMVRSQGLNEMQIQAPPQQQQQVSHQSPDQEEYLWQQVMSLTPEQISGLPEEMRQQIFQLQQMFRGSRIN